MMLPTLLTVVSLLPGATAVLAVNGEQDVTEAADALRAALVGNTDVQSSARTRTLLLPFDGGRDDDALSVARAQAKRAEQLQLEGELDAAADALRVGIEALTKSPHPTTEGAQVAEEMRVLSANLQLGLAPSKETGRGETPEGRAALQLLTEALVRNPTLALDAARYPPRMRRLLEQARVELAQVGLGELRVTSSPSGAKVFVDGRLLGSTPLDVASALPLGTHRVWLEHQGIRSATREVVLTDTKAVLFVDVSLEAGVRATGPALDVGTGLTLPQPRLKTLVRMLEVDDLVLVAWSGADLVAVRVSREGEVVGAARTTEAAALVAVMQSPPGHDLGLGWLPAPEPPLATTEAVAGGAAASGSTETDDGPPWLLIGGGAAAAGGVATVLVAGAAATATAAVVYVMATSTPSEPTVGQFSVTVTP